MRGRGHHFQKTCFVCCFCFIAICGIAFGTPLAPSWEDLGGILGYVLEYFGSIFADAAKLQQCNLSKAKHLVLRGPCLPFFIIILLLV